eukprot:2393799-Rhodomonas_salina.1
MSHPASFHIRCMYAVKAIRLSMPSRSWGQGYKTPSIFVEENSQSSHSSLFLGVVAFVFAANAFTQGKIAW